MMGSVPDFAIWPTARQLASKELAKLARVSRGFSAMIVNEAFLPELLRKRQETLRASGDLTTLAQLHLAEEIALRQPLRLVFDMMSNEVPTDAETGLRSLVGLAQIHPKAMVELEGHTSVGPPALAESISRGRTKAVAKRLRQLGLNRRQLRVSWFCDERLLPDYPDPFHSEHRRVEAFVSLDSVRFQV
mmetsp:Transcript_162281/g.299278  ORF Transcript_162281/g.299278 Transcript_162281/m.299278 type:complete len:189 (+) Transcript_162281:84-650(+)